MSGAPSLKASLKPEPAQPGIAADRFAREIGDILKSSCAALAAADAQAVGRLARCSGNHEVSAMAEDIRAQFFPMSLPAGITGQSVDRATVATEIRALNAQIFRSHELRLFHVPPERQLAVHHLQQSYSPSHPECVVFYTQTRLPVGWFYSYREDPATMFVDTVGFLPAYRGQGLYTAFLPKYLAYVAALGYERVTTTHHPNNRAIMIAELKVGFNIVGLELHESHGPLIRMAYFVHADRREGFEQVFSMAPDPSARTR